MAETCDKHSTRTLELFCEKKTFEKTPNIREIRRISKNRPSSKGYTTCKGYTLCKMVSLGQKLKMPQTCEKHSTRTLELFRAKNRSKKHQMLQK